MELKDPRPAPRDNGAPGERRKRYGHAISEHDKKPAPHEDISYSSVCYRQGNRLLPENVEEVEKFARKAGEAMRHDDGAFLQTLEEGCPSEHHPMQSWSQEYRELQYWQKMLTEYEEALERLKWL